VALIRELAEYERLQDKADPDVDRLSGQLREDAQPRCEALIAETVEAESEAVGFALFFSNYSTFLTRFGIYLEDLFVRPAFRGKGVGFRLLRRVARVAAARGCERIDWAVLDWNTSAIDFYRQIGAEPLDEWTTMRLTGDSIRELATGGEGA
jgi:diamine N-acetyltransferase